MDSTQAETPKSPVSNATLVTSIGLGSGNLGFLAGIFGGIVGQQSTYAATATGFAAAVATFGIGMSIATFVRKSNTA